MDDRIEFIKYCYRCRQEKWYFEFSVNKKGVAYVVCDTCRKNQSEGRRRKMEQRWESENNIQFSEIESEYIYTLWE